MTIEDTLLSIDASLKSLLTIAMTAAAGSAELGKPEAPATKTRAKKADTAQAPAFKLLAGDAEGTRYFLIEKHNTVARIDAGGVVPTIDGSVEVDGEVYAAKKEEFAKKSLTSVSAAQPATPAPAETPAAPAQTASLSAATVSFKQVVDKLIELSKDTRPGKGRDAITAFVAKHGVAKVPALEALGIHAELLAEVEVLLAPDAVAEDMFA